MESYQHMGHPLDRPAHNLIRAIRLCASCMPVACRFGRTTGAVGIAMVLLVAACSSPARHSAPESAPSENAGQSAGCADSFQGLDAQFGQLRDFFPTARACGTAQDWLRGYRSAGLQTDPGNSGGRVLGHLCAAAQSGDDGTGRSVPQYVKTSNVCQPWYQCMEGPDQFGIIQKCWAELEALIDQARHRGVQESVTPTTSATTVPPLERLHINYIGRGKCFMEPDGEGVADVVACSSPHKYEMFADFDLWASLPLSADRSAYPGDAWVERETAKQCPVIFESYVGVTVEASIYDATWWVPDAAAWSDDDRQALCAIVADNERVVVGSARNAAR